MRSGDAPAAEKDVMSVMALGFLVTVIFEGFEPFVSQISLIIEFPLPQFSIICFVQALTYRTWPSTTPGTNRVSVVLVTCCNISDVHGQLAAYELLQIDRKFGNV